MSPVTPSLEKRLVGLCLTILASGREVYLSPLQSIFL